LPGLSFYVPPPAGGATDIDWIVFFTKVTDPGPTVGMWSEEPFDGSTAPTVTLTNDMAGSDTLSGAGYYISESYIPLDQLNFGSNPPPDYPGSPFIPRPSLDGQTLSAGDEIGGSGGSITFSVPEPSSIITLGTGLFSVAAYLGRRRLAARPVRTTAVA
jgi:hypothetical protein